MKNKSKYFIIIAAVSVLLLPTPTQAILGVADFGIFDYFETALGGIEEIAGPIVAQIVQISIAYVISLVALYSSAYFFETVITSTPQWLSINTNPMVLSGWNFISGIANMFIILILIWIALSFILERDTDAMKKALPRLIIIALLMNFSLVFVGGLVDISNIIYNTLLTGNENMVFDIANNLGLGMNGVLIGLLAWITLLAITFIVPFIAPFGQFALALGLIAILPNFFTWIAQIAAALSISSLFFLYAFLFSARVFIIQILAIISPLAFLSYVLPQTKKYWDEWLKHLIEWMFLGIFLLFLLIIGMRAANWIVPRTGANPPPFLGWIKIEDYISYYFFLIVYLGVISFISVKSMPTMAQSIINQGKALGGMMVSRVVKPIGKQAGRAAREIAIGQKAAEEAAAQKKGALGQVQRGFLKVSKYAVAGPTRWAYRRTGTTPEMAAAGKKESKAARAEEARKRLEGQTEEIQRAELEGAIKRKNVSDITGISTAALKDGNLEKFEKEGLFGEEGIEEYIIEANKVGIKTLNSYNPETTAKVLNPEKWKEAQELTNSGNKKGKEMQKEMISETLKKMKPSDVKLMSKKSLTNDIVKKAMVDIFNGNQMSEVGKNFGRDTIDSIQEEIANRGNAIELAKKNPNLALWLHGNAAQNVGFSLPGEALRRDKIKDIVRKGREAIIAKRKWKKSQTQAQQARVPQTPVTPTPVTPPSITIDPRWPKNIKKIVKDETEYNLKIDKTQTELENYSKLLKSANETLKEFETKKQKVDDGKIAISPEMYKEINRQIKNTKQQQIKVKKELKSNENRFIKEIKKIEEVGIRKKTLIKNWEEAKTIEEGIRKMKMKMPPKDEEAAIKAVFEEIDKKAEKQIEAMKKKLKEIDETKY